MDRVPADAAAPSPTAGDGELVPDARRLPVAGEGPRFERGEQLGAGTTGVVVRMHDRDLQRDVAMKFVAAGAGAAEHAALLAEARVAALVEHPNVPPVYDAGVSARGDLWFAMKRIDGQSLARAIDAAADGHEPAAIAGMHRRVGVVLQVCNAVGAAHARNVLHRDIKPSNIMLGGFGEVLLVDWGSAGPTSDHGGRARAGTPWYMSPMQARGEPSTPACDVYALGATLFHLLVGRPPLDAGDDPTFWRRKRDGEIDAPTADERARVPRHLLAIAVKALDADPARRYASVSALADDLARWQAGQPISACRDTLSERARRVLRRHGRRLALAALIVAAIASLGVALAGERLKQLATWGAPTLVERFADDGWNTRWRVLDGAWERRGDRLVSIGTNSCLVAWPRRLSGPCAIEYEAEMLPGCKPCDLSLVWGRELATDRDGWSALGDHLTMQVGAIDADHTQIINDSGVVAYDPFRPLPGVRYRIRCEIVDDVVTLLVDGVVRCRYRDPMPLEGGYFALYAYYPGKAFGDLRVYELGVPQRPPATAIGDAFARRGAWSDAAEEYERVARSHPGTALAQEAIYRRGLSLLRDGRDEAADAAWAELSRADLACFARIDRAEHALARGASDPALDDLDALVGDADGDVRDRAVAVWAAAALKRTHRAAARADATVARFVAAHDRAFAGRRFADGAVIEALCALGRDEEVIDRFPDHRSAVANVLLTLGRYTEIEQRYPEQRLAVARALEAMGRWDEERERTPEFYRADDHHLHTAPELVVPSPYDDDVAYAVRAQLALGQLDEVRHRLPASSVTDLIVRVHQGERPDPAREPNDWRRCFALMARDEPEAVLRLDGVGADLKRDAWARIAVAAWASGDRAREAAARAELARATVPGNRGVYEHVLPALLDGLRGGAWREPLERAVAANPWLAYQRVRFVCDRLLGRCDDAAFLAQPDRLYAAALLVSLRGFVADLAGDAAGARSEYRAYLALPSWRRGYGVGDAITDLVRVRAEVLAR